MSRFTDRKDKNRNNKSIHNNDNGDSHGNKRNSKSLKSRDKTVNKITSDGLVEKNLTTGEDTRISKREANFDLRSGSSKFDFADTNIDAFWFDGFSDENLDNKATSPTLSPTGIRSGEICRENKQSKSKKRKTLRLRHSKTTEVTKVLQSKNNTSHKAETIIKNTMIEPKATTDVPVIVIPESHKQVLPDDNTVGGIDGQPEASDCKLIHQRQHANSLRDNRIINIRASSSIKKSLSKQEYVSSKLIFATDESAKPPPLERHSGATPKSRDSSKIHANSKRTEQLRNVSKRNKPKQTDKPKITEAVDTAKDKPSEKIADKDIKKPTSSPKTIKLEHRVEKTSEKLDKAKNKLPSKRKLRLERTFDDKAGKGKTRLTFNKEIKSQSQHIKGSLPMRPVKFGANVAMANVHRKVFQVENENVGIKAAHRTELLAEGIVRSALRHRKTLPYKKVAKLERRHTQQFAKLAFRRTVEENPHLKKNPISRMWQKRKIKKSYAKAAREAKKAAERAKKAKSITGKASKLLINFVKKNPKLIIFLLLAFLSINIISSLIGMIASGGSGGVGAIFISSYLAEEQEIESASLAYGQWEVDLMLEILGVESSSAHEGYDEYRYITGDISHNPFELIAYLTATQYAFTYTEIETELRSLFEAQYQLTFTPSVETKYRDEERIVINSDGEPETVTESVAYDWKVLTVTLTARNFTEIAYSRMSADQRQHYNLLMQTRGQRQMVGNPFAIGWSPYITSNYGYRIHPIDGTRDLHRGIDIGMPMGTEILAGFGGIITFAGASGGYGNVVIIQADSTNAIIKGVEAKYAHMQNINVSNGQTVKMGDVIGTVGNTGYSTGAHLHLEILRNGNYLNPAFFVDMGTFDYNNPLNPSIPQNNNPPRPPMNDDVWNALIAEAESHLGKSYVFGASGPNTFDCSSYVSWCLKYSGVKDVGRQTAQGLYNLSSAIKGAPQPGDLFFLTGTYSTSNYITHVGIFIGYDTSDRPFGIHAGGSMVQYVYLDTPYYIQHWVGYGRLN